MRWHVLWLLTLILLGACGGGGANRPADCLIFSPVLVAREDVLTPDTAATILRNNETGARVCGWRPTGE